MLPSWEMCQTSCRQSCKLDRNNFRELRATSQGRARKAQGERRVRAVGVQDGQNSPLLQWRRPSPHEKRLPAPGRVTTNDVCSRHSQTNKRKPTEPFSPLLTSVNFARFARADSSIDQQPDPQPSTHHCSCSGMPCVATAASFGHAISSLAAYRLRPHGPVCAGV